MKPWSSLVSKLQMWQVPITNERLLSAFRLVSAYIFFQHSAGQDLCGLLMINRGMKQWGKGTGVLHRSRRAAPSDLAALPEKKERGITAAASTPNPHPPFPPAELPRWDEAVLVIMFNLFSARPLVFTVELSKEF